MEIPKIFWKYFDLYRRKLMTIEEYSVKSGLSVCEIQLFLQEISEGGK